MHHRLGRLVHGLLLVRETAALCLPPSAGQPSPLLSCPSSTPTTPHSGGCGSGERSRGAGLLVEGTCPVRRRCWSCPRTSRAPPCAVERHRISRVLPRELAIAQALCRKGGTTLFMASRRACRPCSALLGSGGLRRRHGHRQPAFSDGETEGLIGFFVQPARLREGGWVGRRRCGCSLSWEDCAVVPTRTGTCH